MRVEALAQGSAESAIVLEEASRAAGQAEREARSASGTAAGLADDAKGVAESLDRLTAELA